MLVGLGVFSTWMKSDRLEPMGKEGSQELTSAGRTLSGEGEGEAPRTGTMLQLFQSRKQMYLSCLGQWLALVWLPWMCATTRTARCTLRCACPSEPPSTACRRLSRMYRLSGQHHAGCTSAQEPDGGVLIAEPTYDASQPCCSQPGQRSQYADPKPKTRKSMNEVSDVVILGYPALFCMRTSSRP